MAQTKALSNLNKKNRDKLKFEDNNIFFNACFDKGHVKDLVLWFLQQYGEKPTINFVESLKFIGFHQATKAGISLGIEDLQIPPDKPFLITEAHIETQKIEQKNLTGSLTSVEKSQCLIDTWNQTSDILRQNAIQNFRSRNIVNPVYMMAFSGARGNVSQVRQLVAMRGLMADPQGAILEFPIQSNFREGLTITEYLISCYGARKGLVDTALRTATSGYLTRRLVDSAQHAVISMIDCGTTRTILIQGKNLTNRLIGRVLGKSLNILGNKTLYANNIIVPTDAKLITKTHTQVFIRSPLTCEATTSVCQFCYGWNLSSGKLVQIGEAVGVIAAQSIGEPGTQLTMRTFHTGGVGVFSDQALKLIFANVSGKVIFEESIPGHFIRTPHGKIVYMIKYTPINPNRIFLRISPISSSGRELIVREQDLPPGSLLFIKHGEFVEAKKLIAQASHVKLLKQRLPESSHPVYSVIEGQIFFEYMNLLREKEMPKDFENSKKLFEPSLLTKNSTISDTRRMSKIGSFWVFSAFNQHEIYTSSPFIQPGDLLSKNSILFNYKFYSLKRTQLNKIKQKLVFGAHKIQISAKQVQFVKKNYRIISEDANSGSFVYQKKDSQNSALFFYPNAKFLLQNFNYKHCSSFYIEPINKQKSEQGLIDDSFPKGSIFNINFNPLKIHRLHLNLDLNKNFKRFPLKNNFYAIFLQNNKSQKTSNSFIKDVLDERLNESLINFQTSFDSNILPKLGWAFIFRDQSFQNFVPTSGINPRQFFPVGLKFNRVCFPKTSVSIKSFKNLSFCAFKNIKYNQIKTWYSSVELVNFKSKFLQDQNWNKFEITCIRNSSKKLSVGLIWYGSQKRNLKIEKIHPKYLKQGSMSLAQNLIEYHFPRASKVNSFFSYIQGKNLLKNPKHPLVSKQKSNSSNLNEKLRNFIPIFNPIFSGCFNVVNLLRFKYRGITTVNYQMGYQLLENTFCNGLTIYTYQSAIFNNPNKFSFKTFLNNWIIPNYSFSRGTVKFKESGEFRYKIQKTTGTFVSIIRSTDVVTLSSNIPRPVNTGCIIRWGQEVDTNFVSGYNGKILKKTKSTITLRLGLPILASANGIVHIFQNDLVFKNQLLITLKSQRLQTEDIVQGIPKIEQLFEARESQSGEILFDTAHIRLRNAFLRELEENEHWSVAVEKSFLEAQQFLVNSIIEAYSNQGVKISEKHVEVIVRQMTSRVRILEAGETGLLPGELVSHSWIQKFNNQIRIIGLREATYEPIILGISKSVLQSESFLLAASFQEVSRVLVRSALSKKRDFLRGLHENVIVGQLIPAGTGLITQFPNSQLNRLN